MRSLMCERVFAIECAIEREGEINWVGKLRGKRGHECAYTVDIDLFIEVFSPRPVTASPIALLIII